MRRQNSCPRPLGQKGMNEGMTKWSEDTVAGPLRCSMFMDLVVVGDGDELPVMLFQGRKR